MDYMSVVVEFLCIFRINNADVKLRSARIKDNHSVGLKGVLLIYRSILLMFFRSKINCLETRVFSVVFNYFQEVYMP